MTNLAPPAKRAIGEKGKPFPKFADYDAWEAEMDAAAITEFWEADAPLAGRGNPNTVQWTDELAERFYLEQLGADALCLCGHGADRHRWTMLGSERSKCEPCWNHGTVSCPKFEPSPYFCNECHEPKADPLSAISCCLCLGCGHARMTHLKRTAASIVSKPSACQAKWCGCNGFGGVIPLELVAVAVAS